MAASRTHLWKSIGLLVIGLSAIAFVAVNIIQERSRTRVIDENIRLQEEKRAEIARENDALRHMISYLGSEDASDLSAMQRGYQQDDQNVMVVKNVAEAEAAIAEIDAERAAHAEQERALEAAERPQWRVWFDVFF